MNSIHAKAIEHYSSTIRALVKNSIKDPRIRHVPNRIKKKRIKRSVKQFIDITNRWTRYFTCLTPLITHLKDSKNHISSMHCCIAPSKYRSLVNTINNKVFWNNKNVFIVSECFLYTIPRRCGIWPRAFW